MKKPRRALELAIKKRNGAVFGSPKAALFTIQGNFLKLLKIGRGFWNGFLSGWMDTKNLSTCPPPQPSATILLLKGSVYQKILKVIEQVLNATF